MAGRGATGGEAGERDGTPTLSLRNRHLSDATGHVIEERRADEIRPAVESLERAARVSAEELRVRWETNRATWERFRGRL